MITKKIVVNGQTISYRREGKKYITFWGGDFSEIGEFELNDSGYHIRHTLTPDSNYLTTIIPELYEYFKNILGRDSAQTFQPTK